MTTLLTPPAARRSEVVPRLHSGDRLTKAELHRRYKATPDGFKAELIEGVVYIGSPVSADHGDLHLRLGGVLGVYEAATPDVRPASNTPLVLGDESEPQPDLHLRILPEFRGRGRWGPNGILSDPPELVVEVAYSSEAIDLGAKRRDDERAGVLNYTTTHPFRMNSAA